ncbi:ubiquitin-like protein 4A isoform X2 [Acipenser ruthenus]|nr:ubiquitin-like protein 4A isoform X2 [Acipenser ruthenus]XP_058864165.1 ubiquitin-like protein 4A isoform X2 [Acipenser ruthenus]XP_058876032.1 ubiquitin-like protein 4A isoform X2 [Acipenser ruthenus]
MRRSPQSGVWSLTGSTYLSINRDSSTKARRWQVSVAQPACSSEQTLQPCRRSESLEQQHKDYERRLRLLSLDDMERLATRMLHPEAVECMELSFLD